MDNWITRASALLCASGSVGLFWTLGVFVIVPWREGRMFALERSEFQLIGVPLLLGIAVAWAALHLFALADRQANPRAYAVIRVAFVLAAFTAFANGVAWALARVG